MIYFLSDAHLGCRAIGRDWAQQNKLIRMLETLGKDAESIYLMGDIFDFWFEYHIRDKSKLKYSPLFRTMRHLVRKGVNIHYFLGNHDMWTFGGIEKLGGVQIHDKPCTIKRYGKQLCLAHGDGLVPSELTRVYPERVKRRIRKFQRLRHIFQSPLLQAMFRCLPPSWGNAIGYGWAAKSRQKELDNPCPYKGENDEELVLYAKEQEKMGNHRDYYIFGHRHLELDLQVTENSRVVLLGDCFRQWTYAQLDQHGNLTLHNYDPDNSQNVALAQN